MKRREILKWGLGAGTIIGASTIAKSASLCLGKTPRQTEGPFYPVVDQTDKDWDLTSVQGKNQSAVGNIIVIVGKVLDQNCSPLTNTLVEIWQACASGKYNHPNDPNSAPLDDNFQYWGKSTTDSEGHYFFKTIIPGAYPADKNWIRPPHVHYKVHKWGYQELTTQLYFAGNQYNKADRILNQIAKGEQDRVVRPIEQKQLTLPGEPMKEYSVVHFDIVLTQV